MIIMLSALLLGTMQTDAAVRVEAYMIGAHCAVRIEGRALTPEDLEREAKQWAGSRREVSVIVADQDVPYRCIGGTIFAIQKAGVYRIGFISELETMVRLTAGGSPCVFAIDGKAVTAAQLSKRAGSWEKSGTAVQLWLDPSAPRPCSESLLAALKPFAKLKLGFLGNDSAE